MSTGLPQEDHDLRWPYAQPDEVWPQESEGSSDYGQHPSGPYERGPYEQRRYEQGQPAEPERGVGTPDQQQDRPSGSGAKRGADDDEDYEWFRYLSGGGPAQAKAPPVVPASRPARPVRKDPQQGRPGKRKAAPHGGAGQSQAPAKSYADPGYGQRGYADPGRGPGEDTHPGYGRPEHADPGPGQREDPDAARRQGEYPDGGYGPGEVTGPGHRRVPHVGARKARAARPDPATQPGSGSRDDREHPRDGATGNQPAALPAQEKRADARALEPSQQPRRGQKARQKEQKARQKAQEKRKEQEKEPEPELDRRMQDPAQPRSRKVARSAAGTKPAQPAVQRVRSSRRSHRLSSRQRLWLTAGVIIVIIIIAAAGTAFALRPVSSGPAHVLATPPRLGAYVKDQKLADGIDAGALKAGIVAKSGGEAKNVVDAVYEATTGAGTALGPEIILFIGGNLSGTSPESFIASFTGKLKGAVPASSGSLGGDAACVPSIAGHPAECAWADNDTFGVIASPTLGAAALANELRLMRPLVEHAAR